MNTLIVFFAVVLGWLIISQLIAWMVTPDKQEDEVVENWFVVFLAPVCLLIVGVEILDERFRKLARKSGVWWL